MRNEVTTDEEYLGAVIGDLQQRRGQVQDVGTRGVKRIVSAHVPLRNMFGYSTSLRSATKGGATFSMQFHSYAEVPDGIAKEIIARATGA